MCVAAWIFNNYSMKVLVVTKSHVIKSHLGMSFSPLFKDLMENRMLRGRLLKRGRPTRTPKQRGPTHHAPWTAVSAWVAWSCYVPLHSTNMLAGLGTAKLFSKGKHVGSLITREIGVSRQMTGWNECGHAWRVPLTLLWCFGVSTLLWKSSI